MRCHVVAYRHVINSQGTLASLKFPLPILLIPNSPLPTLLPIGMPRPDCDLVDALGDGAPCRGFPPNVGIPDPGELKAGEPLDAPGNGTVCVAVLSAEEGMGIGLEREGRGPSA